MDPGPRSDDERFGDALRASFGLAPPARLVVGASAGLDSTVLLRLLHEAGFTVVAAHVNYGLRGAASDADEAFVRGLAAELGLPARVRSARLGGAKDRQRRAREARYAFFTEVAEAEGAGVVAVAHHRDDQVETVLLHLLRGTGVRGLAGMPEARALAPGSSVRLIRPLLGWSRDAIERTARDAGWAWREDASNAERAYRRNRLRHEVLPLLERHFGPGVAERIAETAGRVRALAEGAAAAAALLRYGEARPDGGAVRLDGLRRLAPGERRALYAEALARWAPEAPRRGAALPEIDALLDAQPGRRVAWPGVTVWRDREALVFETTPADVAGHEAWPVQPDVPTVTLLGTLVIEPVDAGEAPVETAAGPNAEVVDAGALAGPLVLRRWRVGDRFRPLGLDGTKRVSDLLTERKVPPSARGAQLVLCRGASVVWVVSHRLAHEARVRPETTRRLRLTWTPAVEG